MPITEPAYVRGQQAGAATRVQQHRTGAVGRRDQRGARLGQPVQELEAAAGAPPLAGQVVVLAGIVAHQRSH
jgi:hypothetical protein